MTNSLPLPSPLRCSACGASFVDPRIAKMMEGKQNPFDPKRMSYGGFKVLVDA